MAEGVERFEVGEPEEHGGPLRRYVETPMDSDPHGQWVRYSDYEKPREALEEAEDRFVSCDNFERPSREEDIKTVWCREPESGEQVDARICLVCRLEAARDQARNQERQRIREALEKAAKEFNERADRAERIREKGGGSECVGEKVAFNEAADYLRRVLLDTLDPSGQEPANEELTMIALALKNQGIEQERPERGVEILIERFYALLKAVEPFTCDGGVSCGSEEVDRLVEVYEQITNDASPTTPSEDGSWDASITVTARKGDVAAAVKALGHANNPSAEAIAFKQTLRKALDPSGEEAAPAIAGSLRAHPGACWQEAGVRLSEVREECAQIETALKELLAAFDTAEKLAGGGKEQETNVNRVLTAATRKARALLAHPSGEQGKESKPELPPQRKAEGGLTTFGLYVRSLRWAVGYIDKLKPRRFRSDERPPSGIDDDWMEWAAAHDLLKDASVAPATDTSKEER